MTRTILRSAFTFLVTLLLSATAQAQIFRAYLASDGNDANPCTLVAPCRLLPAALAAVASGGEIWMLDSANFNTGTVGVTKSVTILAIPGAVGSVVALGGNAIDIATGGVKVTLRNLVIVPLPGAGGTGGVNMTAGTALTVENCLIANLPQTGILVNTGAAVSVTDTTIRDNGGHGLLLQDGARGTVTRAMISGNLAYGVYAWGSAAGTTTTAHIADSTLSRNSYGVFAITDSASSPVRVSVHDSRIVLNVNFGVEVLSNAGALTSVSLAGNMVSHNGYGIGAYFAGAEVWMSGNTVTDSAIGVVNNGSLIESAGNNAVRKNSTNKSGSINVIAME